MKLVITFLMVIALSAGTCCADDFYEEFDTYLISNCKQICSDEPDFDKCMIKQIAAARTIKKHLEEVLPLYDTEPAAAISVQVLVKCIQKTKTEDDVTDYYKSMLCHISVLQELTKEEFIIEDSI